MNDINEIYRRDINTVKKQDEIKAALVENVEEEKEVILPVDAEIEFYISEDRLEAQIKISPPQYGGKEIEVQDINNELVRHGIIFGIDHDLIKEIANKKLYRQYHVIAIGIPPQRGMDGIIATKFTFKKDLIPKEHDDGTVDFRDLGLVINIHKDDVICDIISNSEGEPGKDIYGKPLAAMPGVMPAIPMGANTNLNEDKTKLLASVDGHLVLRNSLYTVETTLVIKNDISINTGNIKFIGDITVVGSVFEGFKVEAGKSLKIQGLCEGAELIAKDSIDIKLGAINSKITCDGQLKLDYAESSKISCKNKLIAHSLVACEVYVEGDLECKNKAGAIMGGNYRVTGNVHAAIIGYRSYTRTSILVGNTAMITVEHKETISQLENLDDKFQQLTLSLDHLQKSIDKGERLSERLIEYYEKAKVMKIEMQLERAQLFNRANELFEQIKNSEQAKVYVSKKIYPNVRLCIGPHSYVVNEEFGKCVAYADEEGIRIGAGI